MECLCVVVVMFGLVWVLENCNGLSTYPVSLDGQTPVIAAVEGAMNIKLFCKVTFNGNPSINTWQLTKFGSPRYLLTFEMVQGHLLIVRILQLLVYLLETLCLNLISQY